MKAKRREKMKDDFEVRFKMMCDKTQEMWKKKFRVISGEGWSSENGIGLLIIRVRD